MSGGEATTGQYSQTAAGGSANGGVDINNPDAERRVSKIVNLLQIIGDDQVTLKVTVAEVSRSVMKQLGVNMIGKRRQQRHQLRRASATNLRPRQTAFADSGVNFAHGNGIQAYINAMEQSGVMKTLAEPTLTAVSGEKATFRVGGEFNLIGAQARRFDRQPDRPDHLHDTKRSNTASASNSSPSCCRLAASA